VREFERVDRFLIVETNVWNLFQRGGGDNTTFLLFLDKIVSKMRKAYWKKEENLDILFLGKTDTLP